MAATEEQIVAPAPEEVEAEAAPAEEKPAVDDQSGENPGAAEEKPRKAKAKVKAAPAPKKKAKSSPSHPTYFEMISEAITTLKERNGSSQYALQKFIEEKHKDLPANFRKLLLANLKKFVASGRLVKVKGSFKLPSARSSAPKPDSPPAKKSKPAAAKPNPKAASTRSKATAAKSKAAAAKLKAVAVKPKAAAVKAKAKPVAAKSKEVAAPVKAKGTRTAPKRKALSDVKTKEKPAKVAKTNAKSTPAKKAAPVKKAASPKKAAAPVKKAAAVKSVKPKSVKSPAKRTMPKRGKK